MMAIIRHEMGHQVYRHVRKTVAMRVVYYNLLFVGIILLVRSKARWLPMFGIDYDSLFLSLFVIIHFVHFKICFFVYEIVENAFTRKFEFLCDKFAIMHSTKEQAVHFREAMLIIFQKNASDYYTDWLYSLVKNHHPTLQERLHAIT
jgi:Zn-dependent protease with chaperone function